MSAVFASIDLGGTNIHAALARADGSIVAERKVPTLSHEGPAAVLQRIGALIEGLAAESETKPEALGIGIPGLVDMAAGVTKFLPNMPTQWREVNVREALGTRLGCPVFLLNDARAAALGELIFGHGRTAETMIFFTLGTGVGGGVVIDGKLRLGPLGAAGEIGHQTILPDGPLCGCGNRGCLEALVSGPALTAEGIRLLLSGNAPKLHELCAGDLTQVSPSTMAAAVAAGEESVRIALQRAGEWLGIGAANLVTALHPELIVIGGGVSALGELLVQPVLETIRRRVGMFCTADVRVLCSALADRGGLYGGIALAQRGGLAGR